MSLSSHDMRKFETPSRSNEEWETSGQGTLATITSEVTKATHTNQLSRNKNAGLFPCEIRRVIARTCRPETLNKAASNCRIDDARQITRNLLCVQFCSCLFELVSLSVFMSTSVSLCFCMLAWFAGQRHALALSLLFPETKH